MVQGVSFEVAAGEKVGIVGRTGSGKSSLIVTLFRIVETDGGSITLDGLDLQGLGLNDVRGRIAAIPQDPVLFSGTVRSNLDPYSRYEDHELWDALSHVALKVRAVHLCCCCCCVCLTTSHRLLLGYGLLPASKCIVAIAASKTSQGKDSKRVVHGCDCTRPRLGCNISAAR